MKLPDNRGCFSKVQDERYCLRHCGHSVVKTRNLPVILKPTVVASIVLYFLSFNCLSQEIPISLTYKSTMIGYGTSSVYDSYLSPLKYTGNNFGLHFEQMKNTSLMEENIFAQQLVNINYSQSENTPGTASYYTGIFEYNYGLLYRFRPVEKLQIFTGTQVGGLMGFVYNTRNGNNPATGKAHLNLSLSAIANYRIQIHSQPVNLRYQFSLPFIGAMYSPQFGQSYYEIGLGVTDGLVHCASFHNHFSARSMLMAEVPLNRFTLSLAYHYSFYETRINDLDTQLITNTFYIGISRNFFIVRGKHKKNNYRYVFD